MRGGGTITIEMQAVTLATSASDPIWLVSHGEAVVGPVSTDLLLRGISAQKVPRDARVRQRGWTEWRSLGQIRETRAGEGFAARAWELAARMLAAGDEGELILLALDAAVDRTRGDVGRAHRDVEPHVGLVTTVSRGLDADAVLGEVVRRDDSVLVYAVQGHVVGSPRTSEATMNIARRLGGPEGLRGVIGVPVVHAGRLVAVLELGRREHPFRGEDVAAVRGIASAAASRLAVWSARAAKRA